MKVHWWPAQLAAPDGVLVIGVDGDGARAQARTRVRAALQDALGQLAGGAWRIHGTPGSAPWARGPQDRRAGVSISHEGALSLGAVHLHGAVGVDLMRVTLPPDWRQVARDYLGPDHTARLDGTAAAFCAAWSAHEAMRKCLGQPLREWDGGADLARCRVVTLDLPAGVCGALALMST